MQAGPAPATLTCSVPIYELDAFSNLLSETVLQTGVGNQASTFPTTEACLKKTNSNHITAVISLETICYP